MISYYLNISFYFILLLGFMVSHDIILCFFILYHINIVYLYCSYFTVHISHTPSMYSIFTYIWLIFMVNVGKYTIHGSYGYIDIS